MSVKAARRFYRVDSNRDLQYLDAGESASAENRWTFEVAWEVANKGMDTCFFYYHLSLLFTICSKALEIGLCKFAILYSDLAV